LEHEQEQARQSEAHSSLIIPRLRKIRGRFPARKASPRRSHADVRDFLYAPLTGWQTVAGKVEECAVLRDHLGQ
jgi:hypothetical protein